MGPAPPTWSNSSMPRRCDSSIPVMRRSNVPIVGNVVSWIQRGPCSCHWPAAVAQRQPTRANHCARSSFAAMPRQDSPLDQQSTAPIASPKENSAGVRLPPVELHPHMISASKARHAVTRSTDPAQRSEATHASVCRPSSSSIPPILLLPYTRAMTLRRLACSPGSLRSARCSTRLDPLASVRTRPGGLAGRIRHSS